MLFELWTINQNKFLKSVHCKEIGKYVNLHAYGKKVIIKTHA